MKKIIVKICGIRSFESAAAAVDAGADLLGFNFVKTSRRFIHPDQAEAIIKSFKGKVKTVGIFQNEDPLIVNQTAEMLDLDFVQLHGDEDRDYRRKITRKIIKRVEENFVVDEHSINSCEFLLLDRARQGVGRIVEIKKAKSLAKNFSTFLAGGLTPENVGELIRLVNPYGVDVASGIETDGKEDLKKIKEFIKKAKEV